MNQGPDERIPTVVPVYTKEEIQLSNDKEDVKLYCFPCRNDKPFFVVLAGGGYNMVALDEGLEVAEEFNRLGFSSVVLNYRVGIEGVVPKDMHDLYRAIKQILEEPERFEIQNRCYGLAGFSSGAHMAGLWCCGKRGYKRYGVPAPSVLFMAYSLISLSSIHTMVENGFGMLDDLFHADRTIRLVCGGDFSLETLEENDVDKQVTDDFPPVYIIHGQRDSAMYFRQSLMLADALKEHSVPYRLRLIRDVGHAFGTGKGTSAAGWMEEAIAFWQEQEGKEHD